MFNTKAPYTEFSSRIHIRRIRELLSSTIENPLSLLSSITSQLEKEMDSQRKKENTQNKVNLNKKQSILMKIF